jgi:ectoine hydroxylase-related dioxygenase (phytanoyl-CoA dioxygenase family)
MSNTIANPLADAQVEEFKQKGFLNGPRVVSDEEADQLKERMFEVIEGRSKRKAELSHNMKGESERVVNQVVNIWEADNLFLQHAYRPELCAMAAQLMDADVVRIWHDQIQYKPPKVGGSTDWHQDHPYWPVIQPADLISAWMALDDADVENGCMWMVPGSHLWGPYKQGTIDMDHESFEPTPERKLLPECAEIRTVPCPVKKGHVMFHHCLTWHGSPNNDSDRGRPAIAVHYMPGHTRYEPQGQEHAMSKRVEVAPGEELKGKYFPTVWDHGPVEPQPINAD